MLSLCCEACKKVIFHVPSELEADKLVGRGERNYEIPSLKHSIAPLLEMLLTVEETLFLME